MQTKKWIIKEQANADDIKQLSEAINVSLPIANMLIQRGIKTYEQAKYFFRPKLQHLYNPFLMKDMDVALNRLEQAIEKQEKVLIFGDYDVDGTTSVSMMYLFLKDKIKDLSYYIPNRYTEGYGISTQAIDFADANNFSLIISLDCGIKATDKVDYANSKNIDFIILDHHEPDQNLPKAIAVLDPKRPDCKYPFKELSACGVGFKLIQAFATKHNIPISEIEYLLDLVALSIASDIVPIVDENRILAYYGLQRINTNPQNGIKEIMNIANLKEDSININDLVFKIGPRINAAGRIDEGLLAVKILTSTEEDKQITKKALLINKQNEERKSFDQQITEEALKYIENNQEWLTKKTTVLYNSSWHKGVIGIVASRLIEHYYRPTIIFTKNDNGLITGSARSVHGFNIYNALEKCQHLTENFGGHAFAAGITLKEENLETFSNLFEETVKNSIKPENEKPIIKIDTVINFNQISNNFFSVINRFAPCGPKNPSPMFATLNVTDNGSRLVGKNKEHLKISVKDQSCDKTFSGIAFNKKEEFKKIKEGKPFNICYHIEENHFMGKCSLELMVKDITFDS